MLGPFKRVGHRVSHRNFHTTWHKVYRHVHSGVVRFVHATAWMFVAMFLGGAAANKIQEAGVQFSRLWEQDAFSRLLQLHSLSVGDLVGYASLMSLPFVLHGLYTAEEKWRKWLTHGHHLDAALEEQGALKAVTA